MNYIFNQKKFYFYLLNFIFFFLFMPFLVQAQSSKESISSPSTKSEGSSSSATADKLDVERLEKQYWAPKDTEFEVVQQRLFKKSNRFSVGLGYGSLQNENLLTTRASTFNVNYFINEYVGFDLNFLSAKSSDTNTMTVFKTDHGTTPNHNIFKSSYSLGIMFAPLYGKMSLLGTKILYFDMAVSAHIGKQEYLTAIDIGDKSESVTIFGLDITQFYYINNHWALRVDLKNQWSTQKRARYKLNSGETESTRYLSNVSNLYSFMQIGVNYFF